jgi:hypothetical protein
MGKNSPVEGSTRLAFWGFLFLVFQSFLGLGGLEKLGLGILSLYRVHFICYYSCPRLWLLEIVHIPHFIVHRIYTRKYGVYSTYSSLW